MCIHVYKGLNKWMQINNQIKSTLNSRKTKTGQISYTLNIIHLQKYLLYTDLVKPDFASNYATCSIEKMTANVFRKARHCSYCCSPWLILTDFFFNSWKIGSHWVSLTLIDMIFCKLFLHELQCMPKQSIGKVLSVNELIYKYQNWNL